MKNGLNCEEHGKSNYSWNFSIFVPTEILDNFKNIKGVIDTDFLFGPYDFYVVAQTEAKEKLSEIALQIRFTKGVASTITCNVIDKATISLVRAHSWE